MKKTITEITEKYDASGKIVERVTKTTTDETAPYLGTYPHWDWTYCPSVTYSTTGTGIQSGYAQSAQIASNKCEYSTATASNT